METINSLLFPMFLIVMVGGFGLLLILSYIIKPKRPYSKVENLMTPTEVAFYKVLQQAVTNQYDIFAQVRLANLITIKQNSWAKYFWDHFRPIGMKSLDFVLCDKATSKILLVIELDDYTHNRQHRILRDQFVDDTLKTVKIPIYHQKVQSWYNVNELRASIQSVIIRI